MSDISDESADALSFIIKLIALLMVVGEGIHGRAEIHDPNDY